ncbi:MAG: hypothetical protein QOF83_2335 [Solirubrobacteraceae bacterium]|nr:hypothetical protein [Solirubrobacteraceae bacterium]
MKLHRWVIVALAATALLSLGAGSAQAASPATTLPAQYVTATTALLRGTVETGGQRTLWAFQYGRSRHYGQTSATRVIPAGRGQVTVSLRVTGLRKRTRYHFQLLTQYGKGTTVYQPIVVNYGSDRTFVTRANGNFGLGPTTLIVKGRYAPVSLYCAGSLPCAGRLTITKARPGHPTSVLTLGQRRVTVKGRQTRTLRVKLSDAALAFLKGSGAQTNATLTITPSVGRAILTKRIILMR